MVIEDKRQNKDILRNPKDINRHRFNKSHIKSLIKKENDDTTSKQKKSIKQK